MQAGENLLFLPKRRASSLSENNRKLPFVGVRVVAQAKILT